MNGPEIGVPQLSGTRMEVLKYIVQNVGGDSCHVLEIGSYEGISALAMSHVVGEKYPEGGSVLCIDPWKPYLGNSYSLYQVEKQMEKELADGTVFERFKRNVTLAHLKAPISYLVGKSSDLSGKRYDLGYDLVFIDGSHKYLDVLDDLRVAAHFLRFGGVLCGDDLEAQFPDCALNELLDEREFNGRYHPGVTRALWHFFSRTVWVDNGVWAVRKVEVGWEDFHAVS